MININDIALSFSNMGLFSTQESWRHPDRIIDTFEIIYVLEGDFYIKEDDIIYEMKPNTVLILHPFHRHKGVKITDNGVKFYWLHFYSENFEKLNLKKIYNCNQIDNIFFLLREIMNLSMIKDKTICDVMLAEILIRLSIVDMESMPKLVAEMREYIRINSDKNISPAKLSELYGRSCDHCSKLFKRFIGISLQEYINKEKIARIKEYLLNTNYSIKEISYLMNFEDENRFVKFFKYHSRKTPTEYRLLHNKIHLNNK